MSVCLYAHMKVTSHKIVQDITRLRHAYQGLSLGTIYSVLLYNDQAITWVCFKYTHVSLAELQCTHRYKPQTGSCSCMLNQLVLTYGLACLSSLATLASVAWVGQLDPLTPVAA